jgi:hypothetical protein
MTPTMIQRVAARYLKSEHTSVFNWRAFGTELRRALDATPVPPKKVTGQEHPTIITIHLQFGRDYFEKPGWDDDAVDNVIDRVAKKHGLVHGHTSLFVTPDGKSLQVGIMAESFGGSPVHLASDEINSLGGLDKRMGLRRINAVIARARLGGFFNDEHWTPVTRLWKMFADDGIPVNLIGSSYSKDDRGIPNAKTWKFSIEWSRKDRPVVVYGQVVASGAGSWTDPLQTYDVVAYAN